MEGLASINNKALLPINASLNPELATNMYSSADNNTRNFREAQLSQNLTQTAPSQNDLNDDANIFKSGTTLASQPIQNAIATSTASATAYPDMQYQAELPQLPQSLQAFYNQPQNPEPSAFERSQPSNLQNQQLLASNLAYQQQQPYQYVLSNVSNPPIPLPELLNSSNGTQVRTLAAQNFLPANASTQNSHQGILNSLQSNSANNTYLQSQLHGSQLNIDLAAQTSSVVTPAPLANGGVIDLLDDENDALPNSKRQRMGPTENQQSPAEASHASRVSQMPNWMKDQAQLEQLKRRQQANQIRPGATLQGYNSQQQTIQSRYTGQQSFAPVVPVVQHKPILIKIPENFVPTWDVPLPPEAYRRPRGRRKFELSLVNVKEFTITGLPLIDGQPSSLSGLRKKIKELSKEHGKASFARDSDGVEGQWRIPLGAYRSFYTYLTSDPLCQVIGIPEHQLKIASLGRERLAKGYPPIRKLVTLGVPRGLATALAPFQRGGVDFVIDKNGRALIADEMGLGKTVQGIASMSVYHRDWPILVLTPSSARYHWENEFQHWLGKSSRVNTEKPERVKLAGESDDEEEVTDEEYIDESNCMELLSDREINVLTSGKDEIFPNNRTRVVICSYGLAPTLVEQGKIRPGMFGSAIVDESHMLKNMHTKRTKKLVPVLHATRRCVLLSGTPAFAKPSELWPQLKILSTEETGWWEEEDAFVDKYVKNTSTSRRAELHAMLTGTVMIRRLKHDILKSLPKKSRAKALVDVSTPAMRNEFHQCMNLLREGKGQLGKLAREHSALDNVQSHREDPETSYAQRPLSIGKEASRKKLEKAATAIKAECNRRVCEGIREIEFAIMRSKTSLNRMQRENLKSARIESLRNQVGVWYRERMHELKQEQLPEDDGEISKKSVLNHMYSLTGKAKLPLISGMIKKWLEDPSKGKLCVFAHHIFVLDELVKLAGLSNTMGSKSAYIRIDGSTSPRDRQGQIKLFQTDPSVRIAILGITAAGVAVTLTASSTIWFAELFWTPAIMIQAEDRCHRIGQNARVNCLYFVATGTLDELLWKLLEKKFTDLGEFVEGMEKQKIVVHKIYHGSKELCSIFESTGDESEEEEDLCDGQSDDEDGKELLKLEHDLEGDIKMLVKEEMTMMRGIGDDDDAMEPAIEDGNLEPVEGSSKEEAIMLSDDEAESSATNARPQTAASSDRPEVRETSKEDEGSPTAESNDVFDIRMPLRDLRAYSLMFEGPSFGLNLFVMHGRVIVGASTARDHEKPAVGDALVAVNGQVLPFTEQISRISAFMKASIERSHVELTFIDIPALHKLVQMRAKAARKRARELRRKAQRARNQTQASSKPSDVIDLLDDD